MDTSISTSNKPDKSGSFKGGSCSLEAPGSPQAINPTHDMRRKLSIIGKTSPFSTCIPAIELSSTQSLEVVDVDLTFTTNFNSPHPHHQRLVRTSSHQSPRMGRKDLSVGGENEYSGYNSGRRHGLLLLELDCTHVMFNKNLAYLLGTISKLRGFLDPHSPSIALLCPDTYTLA